MPPPSHKQSGSESSPKWKIVGLVFLTLVVISGAGTLYWWSESTKIPIDDASLCPKTGPTAIHAILVDRSDPITPLQQSRVRQVIDKAIADAPVGGRVAFYVSETDGVESLAPLIALCNPGREANLIYSNPKRIKERFDKDFNLKIDAVRQRLLIGLTRDNSPIMESLKAVCIDAFGNAPPGVPLKLLIVSDMIQHSALVSHYKDRQYDSFLNSPRIGSVVANCRGSDIDILYLLRPDKRGTTPIQTRGHQRFWDLYLQKSNGKPHSMEPI